MAQRPSSSGLDFPRVAKESGVAIILRMCCAMMRVGCGEVRSWACFVNCWFVMGELGMGGSGASCRVILSVYGCVLWPGGARGSSLEPDLHFVIKS
jgi:hypothetical protein